MWQNEGKTMAMVAQGLPWSPNGGIIVATVVVQCTLLVAQRRHRGGTREEASPRLSECFAAWRIYHVATIGRPVRIHFATITMPLRPFCLIWAAIEQSTTSATLCNTFERPRQPCSLLWASNGDLANLMVPWVRHKVRRVCITDI